MTTSEDIDKWVLNHKEEKKKYQQEFDLVKGTSGIVETNLDISKKIEEAN